jgi:hypothetical protein
MESQAQALVQNQAPVFVEQNLSQWIREIEEDERQRMETPTERRTRERREQIEETRRYLARDGRSTQIVEDVRRLPDGPERREVFRRFWFNLYTQGYQNPLAREDAELLSIRTATLRELEALEDEERRESGGWELARPITLYREDGTVAGGLDRSSPVTELCVPALVREKPGARKEWLVQLGGMQAGEAQREEFNAWFEQRFERWGGARSGGNSGCGRRCRGTLR